MLPDFKYYKAVCSVAQSCLTLCNTIDYSPPVSSIHGIFFLRKNTRVGCYFLLQGIFLTQGWNTPPPYPRLLNPLHWQTDSLPLAPPGKPLLPLCCFSHVRLCATPQTAAQPGFPVSGILQARTLEWIAIAFSNAWKWRVKVKSLSCVRLLATPWTVAYQAPPSMGFSRQEYWSGVPLPSPQSVLRCCKLLICFIHSVLSC